MTTSTDRRSFLKKSVLLPCLAFLTGFKPQAQEVGKSILYARKLLPGPYGNRTHLFSLNSPGVNAINRYAFYEPAVRNAFYFLRDQVSRKWNPLSQDPTDGLLSKGIELFIQPKKFITGTYGTAVAYASWTEALDNLQIILTKLEIHTSVVEI